MKGVDSILSMLREKLVQGRKLQDMESQRLRDAYLTPTWGPTNIASTSLTWVFSRRDLLPTPQRYKRSGRWDRFEQGAAKLFTTFIPELKAGIDKHQAPDEPGAGEGDMADDDDSDKAEEGA